jgi:hypothetical protein
LREVVSWEEELQGLEELSRKASSNDRERRGRGSERESVGAGK